MSLRVAPRPLRPLLLATAAATALALGGCGSDETQSPNAPAGTSASVPQTDAAGASADAAATTSGADDSGAAAGTDDAAGAKKATATGDDSGAADWVNTANKLCAKTQKKVSNLSTKIPEGGVENTQNAAVQVLQDSTDLERDLLVKLKKVEVPADVQSGWDDFLGGIDDALDLIPDLIDQVKSGKTDNDLQAKFVKLAAATRPFAQKHALNACLPGASSSDSSGTTPQG